MHAILIAGVALVGLPILLHLIMKQEPKRLLFPAVRFLLQKRRINQRKMRLRHFLLLLMRALLIALFCLALFQPKVRTSGLMIPITGDQPVAVVLILDTTPSMGYKPPNSPSRFDEARRRALELLGELPSGSRVAVLDPADPLGNWELSVGDAVRKIEGLKEPRGGGPPITTALGAAYPLFKTLDQETDGDDPLPRLVVVISDRAANSWQAEQSDELKSRRDQVPPPTVAHLFIDVGVDQPANVAITSATVKPVSGPAKQAVTITATVQATGPDVPSAEVRCKVGAITERREIAPLPAGTPKTVEFVFPDGFDAGLYQAEVSLEATDAMTFDNVRFVTFRTGETRKLLTIVDEPDSAAYWQAAHRSMGEFGVELKTPAEVTDFAGYDAVCLLALRNPNTGTKDGLPLSERLRQYVDRGGKVLVIPGELAGPPYESEHMLSLLPGRLAQVKTSEAGAQWAVPDQPTHSLIKDFKDWRLRQIDFLLPDRERKAWKYWQVEGAPPEAVIVAYNDDPDPAKRSAAVLEKLFKSDGKVVLLTTRLDVVWPTDQPTPEDSGWHNYWKLETSWGTVFPHQLAKYLAGSAADAAFNFTTGLPVAVPLPPSEGGKRPKLILEGAGVVGKDAYPEPAEQLARLPLPPSRTLTAGHFVLRTEDKKWREGFSLNATAEESNLTKVPDEAITELFGAGTIMPIGKEGKLIDAITANDPEIRLFPWLLIAVLVLFAVEGLVANRFYRIRT